MSASFIVADATRIPLPDASVDLVFGSPPYCDARSYGINAQRDAHEWVDWMLAVTEEALRVTRGAVIWVCAGVTRDRRYWPACEGLLWEGFRRGWGMERPCYWHRVGIPGSGGNQWFRGDVEYCLAFKAVPKLTWSDNTAMGHAPKWAPGGAMSHRLSDGQRVNQWGAVGGPGGMGAKDADGNPRPRKRPSHRFYTKRELNSELREQGYIPPVKANPGNLIKITVGGGQLGHPLAHENEAPFPEALAEWFIRSLCPPGGTTLDPFSGSGTTACVASRLGRVGIGSDIRQSQAELGKRRFERPHQPVARKRPAKPEAMPLFAKEQA